jgi:hypothetical protein
MKKYCSADIIFGLLYTAVKIAFVSFGYLHVKAIAAGVQRYFIDSSVPHGTISRRYTGFSI